MREDPAPPTGPSLGEHALLALIGGFVGAIGAKAAEWLWARVFPAKETDDDAG